MCIQICITPEKISESDWIRTNPFVGPWFQLRVTLLSDYLIINKCPKRLRGEPISIIMYHLCSWNEGLHLLRVNKCTHCSHLKPALYTLSCDGCTGVEILKILVTVQVNTVDQVSFSLVAVQMYTVHQVYDLKRAL